MEEIRGLVVKSTGSWYSVKSEAGLFYQARIKGVIKLDNITSTNPIAVGDWVEYDMEDEERGTVMISEILDRNNYVARQSPHNKRQQHIIASNLDQSILLGTLKSPKTSQGFIDRFLISCEAFSFVFSDIEVSTLDFTDVTGVTVSVDPFNSASYLALISLYSSSTVTPKGKNE